MGEVPANKPRPRAVQEGLDRSGPLGREDTQNTIITILDGGDKEVTAWMPQGYNLP